MVFPIISKERLSLVGQYLWLDKMRVVLSTEMTGGGLLDLITKMIIIFEYLNKHKYGRDQIKSEWASPFWVNIRRNSQEWRKWSRNSCSLWKVLSSISSPPNHSSTNMTECAKTLRDQSFSLITSSTTQVSTTKNKEPWGNSLPLIKMENSYNLLDSLEDPCNEWNETKDCGD